MMSEIILLVIMLSILSFVYSGIIAPSIRLRLRYELFDLRDQVRLKMHKGDEGVTKEQFELMHSGVNNALNVIHIIDLRMLSYLQTQLKNDESLRKRVEKRAAILDACQSDEFQMMRKKTAECVRNAFLVNIGTWFFYLVPVAMVLLCIDKLRCMVKDLFCVPEGEFARISLDPTAA